MNLSFSADLEGNGVLNFELDILDPLLITYNLDSRKNIVELYREGELWKVYYMKNNVQYTLDRVQFRCVDYIQKLDERVITTKTFNGVDAGASAFTVLSDANASEDTFITAGVEDIATLIYKQFDYVTSMNALEVIRDTVKAQTILNTDLTLDFKSSIGSLLSERFVFNYLDPRASNIVDFTVLRDFNYIANDITGKAGVTTSNETDVASIGKYGLVEKFVSFPDADHIDDLNNATVEYKDEHAEVRLLPQIQINNAIISLSCYTIGDKVTLVIKKGALDLNGIYQIVAISVDVDDTGFETVNLIMSENTFNNREPNFLRFVENMDQRLQYIELNT